MVLVVLIYALKPDPQVIKWPYLWHLTVDFHELVLKCAKINCTSFDNLTFHMMYNSLNVLFIWAIYRGCLFVFVFCLFFLENVGHFVLLLLFTYSVCNVISITCFSALYIGHLVLFLLCLLILDIQCFQSIVHFLLVSVFGSLLHRVAFWHCSLLTSCFCNYCVGLFCCPHQVGLPLPFSFSLVY